MLAFQLFDDTSPVFWFGYQYHRLAFNARFGLGKGAPGRPRGSRKRIPPPDVWSCLLETRDEARMHGLTHDFGSI